MWPARACSGVHYRSQLHHHGCRCQPAGHHPHSRHRRRHDSGSPGTSSRQTQGALWGPTAGTRSGALPHPAAANPPRRRHRCYRCRGWPAGVVSVPRWGPPLHARTAHRRRSPCHHPMLPAAGAVAAAVVPTLVPTPMVAPPQRPRRQNQPTTPAKAAPARVELEKATGRGEMGGRGVACQALGRRPCLARCERHCRCQAWRRGCVRRLCGVVGACRGCVIAHGEAPGDGRQPYRRCDCAGVKAVGTRCSHTAALYHITHRQGGSEKRVAGIPACGSTAVLTC